MNNIVNEEKMNERTFELIELIRTLPGVKLAYHPRRKDYEVSLKDGGRYMDGWAVLGKVKFFYETMTLQMFDSNEYTFHVLGKSVTFLFN